MGDKEGNTHKAIEKIQERIGDVVAVSAFLITEPVGFVSDNKFLNAACEVHTKLSAPEVLECTQIIEREVGRKSKSANGIYSDRIIDIDILLYDDKAVEYPYLTIPHPRMHERAFVLFPLNEIASDVIHPVFNKTIKQLKEEIAHSGSVS